MDGRNSFNRQYEALYTKVLVMDAQSNRLAGAAHAELLSKKTETLDQMVRLCAAHGQTDYQRQCEHARILHAAKLPDTVDGTSGIEISVSGRRSFAGVGNRMDGVVNGNVNAKTKKECSGKNRLANVEAETLDQVNDKKVAEKSCQLDRVFVKLERMTRLRVEDSKKYPRQSSVIITVSECKANSGGGNRTKLQSPEEKRRDATLVVIRSAGSSMLRDGTLRSALLVAAEKLTLSNDERIAGGDEILQQQHRFSRKGLLFDVAVALDWKTYFQHVFAQQSNAADQSSDEERRDGEREQNKKARIAVASSYAEGLVDTGMFGSYPMFSPPPLHSLLAPPPSLSYLHPAAYVGMSLADDYVGTPSPVTQELLLGRSQEEASLQHQITRQELSPSSGTRQGAAVNRASLLRER